MDKDNWKHRSKGMRCGGCMYFVPKVKLDESRPSQVGRCRRNAPTMNGWPVLFDKDWCGAHKLDEEKLVG